MGVVYQVYHYRRLLLYRTGQTKGIIWSTLSSSWLNPQSKVFKFMTIGVLKLSIGVPSISWKLRSKRSRPSFLHHRLKVPTLLIHSMNISRDHITGSISSVSSFSFTTLGRYISFSYSLLWWNTKVTPRRLYGHPKWNNMSRDL